jgi:hypothetical protein
MTATASKFDEMNKEELRAACREAGVPYGKLNNYGMRAALVMHYAKTDAVEEQVEAEVEAEVEDEEVETKLASNSLSFAQMLGVAPMPTLPTGNGPVTCVVDGKRVEAKSPKTKGEPCPRSNKPEAPVVPRVSRKGYTIQKEREERNGVKRPSEGTVCGAVWAAFDKNPEIKAGELADLADANGWNPNNVSCEFYAWRKFMGIKGRAAK